MVVDYWASTAMNLPAEATAQAGGQTDAKEILCKNEAYVVPEQSNGTARRIGILKKSL